MWVPVCAAMAFLARPTGCASNLIDDPSFEQPMERDQFGHVFAKWSGWNYEGDCKFEVGLAARTGAASGMMSCAGPGKIRLEQLHDLAPGRYAITAYIRGLEIERRDVRIRYRVHVRR